MMNNELLKLFDIKDDVVDTFTVDKSGKLNGKGCYLKKDVSVIDTAQKKKILDNVFEKSVPDEIYDELRSSI